MTRVDGAARAYWLDQLSRMAEPVLTALAERRLKRDMPVESTKDRSGCTYLEAAGRTLCGIAPWLELEGGSVEEQGLRGRYREIARAAINAVTDPASPDYGGFAEPQTLVDTAFLSHAFLRAPQQLWHTLDESVRERVVAALLATRAVRPPFTNWLLFAAMVELALKQAGEPADRMRIDYALRQHLDWYKGDGAYGDGPEFRYDYYNSYVIQPMLLDVIAAVAPEYDHDGASWQEAIRTRARRYAEVQERLIAPDGSFPVIGRSIAYRGGAFQLLAQASLQGLLPDTLPPAQVRCALQAVIRRCMEAPGTYDDAGWLQIGLAGHQPSLGEHYISTGSLYLASACFLPLGLPATDPFWSDADQPWTSVRIWGGQDAPADHALHD